MAKFDYDYQVDGQIKTWNRVVSDGATNVIDSTFDLAYDNANQLIVATLKDNTTTNLIKRYGYVYDNSGNRLSKTVEDGSGSSTSLNRGKFNSLNQLLATNPSGEAGQLRVVGKVDKDAQMKLNGKVLQQYVDAANEKYFLGQVDVPAGSTQVEFDVEATDYRTPPNTTTKRYRVEVSQDGFDKTYEYDLNGNLTSEYAGPVKTRTYSWDSLDQLLAIHYTPEDAQDQSRTEFVYDGQGRRSKIVEYDAAGTITETRVFFWHGLSIVQERDGAGLVVKRFLGSGFTTGASATPADSEKHFYTRDHLGSTRHVVTGLGALAAAYEYSPYGIVTKLAGTIDS